MTRDDPHATALSQLTPISLDTEQPICQVCGQTLQKGEEITAYAYRAAGEPTYAIGYVMCGADTHEHPTVFTRGVHEDILTGHIGTCLHTQTRSMQFVLLNPRPVATSPPSTADPHVHSEAPTPRDPTDTPQHEPPSLLTAVRDHARSDGGAHGGPE